MFASLHPQDWIFLTFFRLSTLSKYKSMSALDNYKSRSGLSDSESDLDSDAEEEVRLWCTSSREALKVLPIANISACEGGSTMDKNLVRLLF